MRWSFWCFLSVPRQRIVRIRHLVDERIFVAIIVAQICRYADISALGDFCDI